jgi:hypothetical protein
MISLTEKLLKNFRFFNYTFTDNFVSAAVRRSCLKHLEQYIRYESNSETVPRRQEAFV